MSARDKSYRPMPVKVYKDRIQLREGTTFLPGPKDPAVTHLIAHILEDGFVILPNIFTRTQVSSALDEISRLQDHKDVGPAAKGGRNPFEGFKTERIHALADKSRVFDCFATHPTVLALNDYFLQPNYQLSSFSTVVINPGEPAQTVHTDDGLISLPRPKPLMGVGTMIALDDFTATNGATTIVPGSHLWPDARQPTPEEMIPTVMPSGSMVYFLNTTWHSGGGNASDRPRRALTVQYAQPWLRTFENMTVAKGWEDLDSVPKRLLDLMGFSQHEFLGFVDGRSPRAGVEMRKKRLIEWGLREKEKKEKKRRSKL